MTFIARILRALFWVLVVSWTLSMLRGLVRKMAGGTSNAHPDRAPRKDAVGRKLVRDPVCGMHIAEGLAIALSDGVESVHFCSLECRERYLHDTSKLAAHAS
jgi:YHS domain-containing protein